MTWRGPVWSAAALGVAGVVWWFVPGVFERFGLGEFGLIGGAGAVFAALSVVEVVLGRVERG